MNRQADWAAAARGADPPADRAIAAIIGPWDGAGQPSAEGMRRLALATQLMAGWTSNASLGSWAPPDAQPSAPADAGQSPAVAQVLQAYLAQTRALPAWARPEAIERGEQVFMEYGPLSCVLLFCASLPECYVLPHLAQVLHAAGQLEAHTEHRIRQTAAMVFPVMMKGGLTTGEGGGVAQVLKVRLIHATIRHLILRGPPGTAPDQVAPLAAVSPRAQLHQALMAMGWDVQRQGMPCSQLELAYTLLTFHFVFLRGMRQLGLPLSREEEESYLHTWNVAGHVLGIRDELMPQTMEAAAVLFEALQAKARAQPAQPDVRAGLGSALMEAMAQSIRVPVVRSLPVPLTRWLIGGRCAVEVGVSGHVGLLAWLLFVGGMACTRALDALVRVFVPGFSLTRMFTRVIGYHLLTRFLLDQTRPLNLPEQLLQPLHRTVADWHHDPRSPGWVNRLEDRLTAPGSWRTHCVAGAPALPGTSSAPSPHAEPERPVT